MGDSLDLPRIDPLPSRNARDAVTPSRDRPPQKRRHPPPRPKDDDLEAEEEQRQVGSRLDVRA
jgi:hypothetical protein